jgi:hypothetical protein
VGYFVNPPLPLQSVDAVGNSAVPHENHCPLEILILLSHDLVQLGSFHPSFLKFLKYPTCFD